MSLVCLPCNLTQQYKLVPRHAPRPSNLHVQCSPQSRPQASPSSRCKLRHFDISCHQTFRRCWASCPLTKQCRAGCRTTRFVLPSALFHVAPLPPKDVWL